MLIKMTLNLQQVILSLIDSSHDELATRLTRELLRLLTAAAMEPEAPVSAEDSDCEAVVKPFVMAEPTKLVRLLAMELVVFARELTRWRPEPTKDTAAPLSWPAVSMAAPVAFTRAVPTTSEAFTAVAVTPVTALIPLLMSPI